MKITMIGEYAIRAMMHMAAQGKGVVVNISDVSGHWDIPESILRKIIPRLRRAGFIRSIRGNSGGICLAGDAQQITPLDIIESIEGEIVLNPCLLNPEFCNRTEICEMHSLWNQARDQLRQILCSTSISEMAEKELGIRD